jgi:ubiquinone biosynthesis protein
MRGKIKKSQFKKFVSTIAKHGFADILHDHNLTHFLPFFKFLKHRKRTGVLPSAKKLADLVFELGPGFVEIGKIAASRGNIVPEEYQDALLGARGYNYNIKSKDPISLITAELGKSASRDFAHIDKQPYGSHLFGFVYKGILRDGKRVLIILNDPEQKHRIYNDIEKIEWIFDLILPRIEKARFSAWRGVFDEFKENVDVRGNLVLVAGRIKIFDEQFCENKKVTIPDVHWEYLTKSVLVQSYKNLPHMDKVLNGRSIAVFSKKHIVKYLSEFFAWQYFVGGHFFTKPLLSDIQIGKANSFVFNNFLDIGFLDEKMRIALARFLKYLLANKLREVAKILLLEHYKLCDMESCARSGLILESSKSKKLGDRLRLVIQNAQDGKIIIPQGILQAIESILHLEIVVETIDQKADFSKILLAEIKKLKIK